MGGAASLGGGKTATTEKVALLKQTPFFVLLENDELCEVAKYFSVEKVPEGKEVQQQAFIVVAEGELSVSTLVPKKEKKETEITSGSNNTKRNKKGMPQAHVAELLCVKKKGDFFAKAARELISRGSNRTISASSSGKSAQKVVHSFDFTTMRAMVDTTILKLDSKRKQAYLKEFGDTKAGILNRVLNLDIRQMLRPIPFLKGVEGNKLASLAELFVYESFQQGEFVVKEGAEDDSFYLVLHGCLEASAIVEATKMKTRSVTVLLSKAESQQAAALAESRNAGKDVNRNAELSDDAPPENVVPATPKHVSKLTATDDAASDEATSTANEKNEDGSISKVSEKTHRPLLGRFGAPKEQHEDQPKKRDKVPVLRPMPSMRLLRKSSGLIKSEMSDPDGNDSVVLGKITAGSYFGEMGMMIKMPRTATIKAKEKCLLARLSGADFKNFLKLSPDVADMIDLHMRDRMVRKLYAFKLPFFAGIPKEKLLELAHHCELAEHRAGDVLLSEGDKSGVFYIVIYGIVNVVKNGNAVVRLAKGAYFGEISLITGRPHLATIKAHSNVVLLKISKEEFRKFFADEPTLLSEFEMRVLGEKEMLLGHILRHTLGAELFAQHLANEYTLEHLEFWKEVERFRKGEEGLSHEKIIGNFIGEGAKTPVNISATQIQNVLSATPSPSMFDEAQEEIFNLMKRDNFERFKKTTLFVELMDAIQCYTSEDLKVDENEIKRAAIIPHSTMDC
ncbi:cAMP-dependent protein kinase regulatory subunit (PKA regulatory subunit) [Durusdinium trenchii]|uniref:cAMP-dependent protein kinase regulatory subunit (PKA regulatory subunit) n=1 Tax=Durusdinium trenchii TaxID=1381693 RepID=A0ABP0S829_9DINO